MEVHRLCGDVAEAQALCIAPACDGRLTVLCGYLNGFLCAWDAESHVLRARWQAHAVGVMGLLSCAAGEVWRCVSVGVGAGRVCVLGGSSSQVL